MIVNVCFLCELPDLGMFFNWFMDRGLLRSLWRSVDCFFIGNHMRAHTHTHTHSDVCITCDLLSACIEGAVLVTLTQ